ncbi:family 78 glycoside hydrolase catalytic domain [Mediterraneibacter agrestimuris]|uniref:family 78 glycoside hydrolase catalytic domain n=1 Tax=Mediterraneibacter agrestimuris TaxID=2941333 RepID=UPI0020400EB1|nr:family 78 glycoside hydrolase catalytic domain [Mediterraneibacter agrestimuris]
MKNHLGKWITGETAAPFYARKKIKILKAVKKATVNVCGLGQFHFYINGKKVEDHELDPGWTDYRKLVEYVTFDVTKYLTPGENVLGAEVGNGWYIKMDEHYTFHFPEFMPPNPNPYQPFGKHLVLALKLVIDYEDGSSEIITADDTFQTQKHPVVMSNVYGSETIDGRIRAEKNVKGQPLSQWCNADYDASGWRHAVIVDSEDAPKGLPKEQIQPPVKVIQSYEGKYLRDVNNRAIYDFGQNMSGILEFDAKGNTGDTISIYPAEKLSEDGDVDQIAKNWTNVDSCITYIIGEDHVWETCRMKFTYFAGRYAAVAKKANMDGSNEPVQIRNLTAHAVTSAHVTHGMFTCDEKRYEQIYHLVEKSVEANMLSVHTDCPTIERFAWQEPNHLMAPSIMYMKDGRKLWEKFLLDMRTAQHKDGDYFLNMDGSKYDMPEGLMPSQCPCYIPNVLPVPGLGDFYDIIPWGSTCILGTYWHYVFYGDKKIIEENYDAGMRYLKHLKTKVNAGGFLNHGLGDWGNPKNELVRENVETAFLYADTITLAYFAEILGNNADQKELEDYAQDIKQNYNEKLLVWNEEKGFWCYRAWEKPDEIFMTQAAEALPLYWGLAPKEKEADIVKAFRYTLEQEQAFVSGEVGLPYVIQTARKYDMNDLICRFILRKKHPSYYAFVLDGETTLGEYWETNPRSHCHDMMGHIIEWYYNGIAGIQPEKPGFEKVTICPYLPPEMQEFRCSYESVKGKFTVHVKADQTQVLLETAIPQGVEYRIDTKNLELRGKAVIVNKI